MKEEVMKKFHAASTVEELLSLAKEENIEISQEEAKALLSNSKDASCELDDSELDNVSGGASTTIGSHKYKVVTSHHYCDNFEKGYTFMYNSVDLDYDGELVFYNDDHPGLRRTWYICSADGCCGQCDHLQFKGCTGICDIPLD